MRFRDEAHLDFIRSLPCMVCDDPTATEAAHIRYADHEFDKPITGTAIKPDDNWTVPLCSRHHREQTAMGEGRKFWAKERINPLMVACALYGCRGSYERGLAVLKRARR